MAGASEIRAGKAVIEVSANDSKLAAGLARSQAKLTSFGASITAAGLKLGGLGLAALTGLGYAVRAFAQSGNDLAKMAMRTGVSVEALSELGVAAELGGAHLEDVEHGLRHMSRFLLELAEGGEAATSAINALGSSFDQIRGMNQEQRFQVIGDGLARITDPARRAALAMRIFGRGGSSLLPMFGSAAASAEDLRRRISGLGATVTGEAAAALAAVTAMSEEVRPRLPGVPAPPGPAARPIVPPTPVPLPLLPTLVGTIGGLLPSEPLPLPLRPTLAAELTSLFPAMPVPLASDIAGMVSSLITATPLALVPVLSAPIASVLPTTPTPLMLAPQMASDLRTLNIRPIDLQVLSPTAQVDLLIERLASVVNPATQAAIAMRLFGSEADRVMRAISGMGGTLVQARRQAREFGLTISTEMANRAAAVTEALVLLSAAGHRSLMGLGSALGPTVTNMSRGFAGILRGVNDWIDANGNMVRSAAAGAIAITALGGAMVGVGLAFRIGAFALAPVIGALKLLSMTAGLASGVLTSSLLMAGRGVGLLLRPVSLVRTIGPVLFAPLAAGARLVTTAFSIAAAAGETAWSAMRIGGGVIGGLANVFSALARAPFVAVAAMGSMVIAVIRVGRALGSAMAGIVAFRFAIAGLSAGFNALKGVIVATGVVSALVTGLAIAAKLALGLGTLLLAIPAVGSLVSLVGGAGLLAIAFGSISRAATGAWGVVSSGAVRAATEARRVFGAAASFIGETWVGVANAMQAGDFGLAGEIAMASLRVGWAATLEYMRGLWTSFGDWFTDTFGNSIDGLWTKIKVGFIETIAFLRRQAAGLQNLFNNAINVITGGTPAPGTGTAPAWSPFSGWTGQPQPPATPNTALGAAGAGAQSAFNVMTGGQWWNPFTPFMMGPITAMAGYNWLTRPAVPGGGIGGIATAAGNIGASPDVAETNTAQNVGASVVATNAVVDTLQTTLDSINEWAHTQLNAINNAARPALTAQQIASAVATGMPGGFASGFGAFGTMPQLLAPPAGGAAPTTTLNATQIAGMIAGQVGGGLAGIGAIGGGAASPIRPPTPLDELQRLRQVLLRRAELAAIGRPDLSAMAGLGSAIGGLAGPAGALSGLLGGLAIPEARRQIAESDLNQTRGAAMGTFSATAAAGMGGDTGLNRLVGGQREGNNWLRRIEENMRRTREAIDALADAGVMFA